MNNVKWKLNTSLFVDDTAVIDVNERDMCELVNESNSVSRMEVEAECWQK